MRMDDDFARDSALIRELVQYDGSNPAVVAKKAGVAVSTINRPFNGTATNRLGRSVLEKLQAAFPRFPGWPRPNFSIPASSEDGDVDTVQLREIDLQYGMGATYLDVPVTTEMRTFSREWLRGFTKAPPEVLFWATGDGDSMEPTIRAGETFLIDTSQRTPRMSDGIWALAIGEIGMVKRLSFQGGGFIELHSDNPLVRPMPVSEDELHVIGRVIAVVRRL